MSMGSDKKSIRATTSPVLPVVDTNGQPRNAIECALEDVRRDIDAGRARIPALSPVARHAERLAERAVVSRADLLRVAEAEPAVAARVLHLANTRYQDPQLPHVASLDRAVDLVGPDQIRQVIASLARTVPEDDGWDAASHELRKLWTNTLFTALMARELAEITGAVQSETAFVAGLFHNVGEVLLVGYVARWVERQQQVFRVDDTLARVVMENHEDLGFRLLNSWSFPAALCRLAGEHHGPIDSPLKAVVIAGYEAALDYGYGYLGAAPDGARFDRALRQLGLPRQMVTDTIHRIGPELNDSLTMTG